MANDYQQIESDFSRVLEPAGLFTVDRIMEHVEPHPYCIGANHVAWASDKWGGMLSNACIEDMERSKGKGCCEVKVKRKKCALTLAEHKRELIILVKLTRSMSKKEAGAELFKLKSLLEDNKLAGIGFSNTNEFSFTEE